MNIEQLRKTKAELSAEVEFAEAVLHSYDEHRGDMGLLPDAITKTDDYKAVKRQFNEAFERLREFNGKYSKILRNA